MNEILLVAGMAIVTFAVRYPLLELVGKIALPDPVLRALKYVPPSVLVAIILPAILIPSVQNTPPTLPSYLANHRVPLVYVIKQSGQIDPSPLNSYLMAGIVAALIAWRSKNLLLTIVMGMAFFWTYRWILSLLLPGRF